jgi:hypothetical protein
MTMVEMKQHTGRELTILDKFANTQVLSPRNSSGMDVTLLEGFTCRGDLGCMSYYAVDGCQSGSRNRYGLIST